MARDAFLSTMGARIAQQRKDQHLTQEQLADFMGVSLQTVSCIELGKQAIRPENLANLCVCLNTTSDYILYGKRNETQMTELIAKVATLPPEDYALIQSTVNLLHKKNM